MIDQIQGAWAIVLMVVRGALVIWALVGAVEAARAPEGAYVAEGKWNKWGWTAVCVAGALALWFSTFGMLGIIAMVVVGVFYADVRPAVRQVRR